MSKLLEQCKLITVEPVLFLHYAAFDAYNILSTTGVYWKICRQKFANASPPVDCMALKGSAIEDEVQADAAKWQIYIGLSYMLPIIVAGLILGAFGDREGRKLNIMLGCAGAVLYMYTFVFEFTFAIEMPLFAIPIMAAVTSLTGFMGIIWPSCYAYVADRTPIECPEQLTIHFTVLQMIANVAYASVNFLISFLLVHITYAQAALLPMFLWLVAFLYALSKLEQVPLCELLTRFSNKESCNKVSPAVEQKQPLLALTPAPQEPLVVDVWRLLKASLQTGIRCRRGNFRAYVFVCIGAYMIITVVGLGMHTTINLFLLHPPLTLGASDIAFFNGCVYVLQMVANLGGLALIKWFRLHESTILIIAMASMVLRLVLIAFSRSLWMLYVAAAFGGIGTLAFPMVKSLAKQFIDTGEIGRLYALFQLVYDVAIIISYTLVNAIYAATVTVFAGTAFLVVAGAVSLSLCSVIWLFVDYREHRAHETIAGNGAGDRGLVLAESATP